MSPMSLARSSRPLRRVQLSTILLFCPARSLLTARFQSEPSLTQRTFTRTYTSHHDAPSVLFSSALDQHQRPSHPSREDSVGPFQLGISQAALKRGESAKKWSELSVGGKVIRTTQRTTNLTVILFGAGLSAVLIYALTSELFSKNSPTVLYNDACERIRSSPRVAQYLHAPLTFHSNPPSSVRPRHRHRHVASQIAVDSSGREHMLLSFYIQSSSSPSLTATGDDKESQWANYVGYLTSLTFEDVNGKVTPFIDSARRTFKYLRGDVVPSAMPPVTSDKEKSKIQERTEEHSWLGLTRLFSGLRGQRSHGGGSHGTGIAWTEGEVHADLVRNDEGYFVFRYLLIDIPNSDSHNPIRVFVERAPGVLESEPIMRFHSS